MHMLDKFIKGFQGKHFSPGGEEHFLHVFPADPEPAPADTGDYFLLRIILRAARW